MPRAANPHTVVVKPWVGRALEPVTLPMLRVYRARCSCRWTSAKYLSAEDARAAGTAHRSLRVQPAVTESNDYAEN